MNTKIELFNDHTLKHALSILKLSKLELFLQHKNSFNVTHYNTVPLIKPKVLRWNQYKYEDHDNPQQQRKDSGIELESHLYSHSTSLYGNYAKESEYHSKRPSLNMLLSSKNNSHEDLPSISHSVDSSPSSSPSTIASSSPSSPMITFSDPAPMALTIKSSKKYKGSSWSPSTSPIYFCKKVTESGNICGQTFQRPYDLSRHQTIHLKNRPFVYCQQCGKRFTRVDALRRHERVQGHYQSNKHNRNHHPHHHKEQIHTQHIYHRPHSQSISLYPI
ncbi:hypothetical protein BCR42DRAFT_438008 [Absidia repens]|uniref:C2H2-type domain-containing protein n=1 Tax=Absidia repens TaxID=90262 RepID=A0A1X2IFU1_9FUNG|nr:hypothetical protein BCR42DRAFT_438008 [Absidia repens]